MTRALLIITVAALAGCASASSQSHKTDSSEGSERAQGSANLESAPDQSAEAPPDRDAHSPCSKDEYRSIADEIVREVLALSDKYDRLDALGADHVQRDESGFPTKIRFEYGVRHTPRDCEAGQKCAMQQVHDEEDGVQFRVHFYRNSRRPTAALPELELGDLAVGYGVSGADRSQVEQLVHDLRAAIERPRESFPCLRADRE